ncbi:nucleotide exchange factor GrpE [Halohasta salina]|uniref:nucleotide exchange factor GrpE n=1 Tax=Halohasta salina TaxID=2961621 RepID=UPI0020A58A3E|nr:nucleotide exchange factor GrpE [Halohasta salina]
MSDDPAAVDESAAEPTDEEDAEADVAETAGTEMFEEEEEEEEITDDERTVDDLEARIEELETELDEKDAEIDELTEKLQRSRADFQNYKKRMEDKQEEMQARATEDLVSRFTKIRGNLVRALDQDEDADIRPGIQSTLDEFDAILREENVEIISPEPGDEVDPQRHEVMMRVEGDQPDGTIVDVYQDGYEMAGKVLQAAQVTVSSDDT